MAAGITTQLVQAGVAQGQPAEASHEQLLPPCTPNSTPRHGHFFLKPFFRPGLPRDGSRSGRPAPRFVTDRTDPPLPPAPRWCPAPPRSSRGLLCLVPARAAPRTVVAEGRPFPRRREPPLGVSGGAVRRALRRWHPPGPSCPCSRSRPSPGHRQPRALPAAAPGLSLRFEGVLSLQTQLSPWNRCSFLISSWALLAEPCHCCSSFVQAPQWGNDVKSSRQNRSCDEKAVFSTEQRGQNCEGAFRPQLSPCLLLAEICSLSASCGLR